DANGDISPSGTVMLNQNENQTFTITPHAGYAVKRISVDGADAAVGPSYTFTNVTANHTISVAFAIPTAPMDASVVDDAGVADGGATDGGTGENPVDAGRGPGGGGKGCSCQMGRGSTATPALWILALLLVAHRVRRRRRQMLLAIVGVAMMTG